MSYRENHRTQSKRSRPESLCQFRACRSTLRAGAQPVPLRVWVRHRNAAVQALLRGARRLLARGTAAPEPHVFRDATAAIEPDWYGGGGDGEAAATSGTDRAAPREG